MKRKMMRVFLLTAVFMLFAAFAVGCTKIGKKYYTVTLIDGDTVFCRLEAEMGKKLELPDAPVREDKNYVFDGWYFDENAEKIWDTETERVTNDVVLWSNFLYVSDVPGTVKMDGTAFSNTVTWLQRGLDAQTEFSVKAYGGVLVSQTDYEYSKNVAYEESGLSGEKGNLTLVPYKNHDDIFTVKWTPEEIPQGGVYSVEIECANGSAVKNDLCFKGEGTQENKYLLTDSADLAAINSEDIPSGKYYKLYRSFNVKLLSQNISGKTFDGILDGNGKTVTIDAGGCGLFGTLGENAVIEDLTVAGNIADTAESCAGVIAAVNNGKISYCTVTAGIESSIGKVGTLEGDKDSITGGAGGIVGVNNGVVSNCGYTGAAKAKVGAGGIAVINNGSITDCTYGGTLGAGNAVESGSSTNNASYMGGIASINYGRIESCSATGRLLAQRSMSGGGTNNNVGGIVALNTAEGSINRCFTTSQRVYGNNNVGGIAGENSGAISYCYVTANYRGNISSHNYIGGSANVGGIAGLTNTGATVRNCYVLANVYSYEGAAYKVASSCESCAYLEGNLDERDFTVINTAGDTKKTAAKSLTYPGGDNIAVELTAEIKEEYKAKAYALTLEEQQYATLNGTDGYYSSKTNLTFSAPSTVKDRTIKVEIVLGGNDKKENTLTKAGGTSITLSSPDKEDSYVIGYTLIEGSNKTAFGYKAVVGYDDVAIFDREKVTLYPVYVNGTRPESYVLKVAIWSRYVEENTVNELLEAYKASEYYNDKYSVITGVLSSSNNGNFKTDYDNGDYNVAFAYASKDVSAWQNEVKEVYIRNVSSSAYGALKVGLNGSDSVVANFGKFLDTDQAKKIMCPDYVEAALYNGAEQTKTEIVFSGKNLNLPTLNAEEGYVFEGWSVNAEPTEGETLYNESVSYDELSQAAQSKSVSLYARFAQGEPTDPDTILRVAVFKNSAFDPDIASRLVEAFIAYCTDNEIECNVAKNDLLSETKYADFTAAAVERGYNIAIGFQANDFTAVHGIPAENIKDIRLSATSTRRIALLNDDALAVEFFGRFIESDAAKKIMNPDHISEAEADKLEITLMDGDEQYGEKLTVSNATEGDGREIKLPVITPDEGIVFLGWATTAEAQEDEEYLSGTMDYAAVLALATEGKLTLYARYKEGEKPQILKVAIWTRYVEEDTVKALLEAFKTSEYYGEGYSVVTSALSSSNNGNFKTDYEAGDFNVAFGYAAAAVDGWQDDRVEVYIYNVNTSAYGNLKVGLNGGDEIVTNFGLFLKTDEAKKIMNPAYISEAEAEPIEVTLYSGATQYGDKLTVSNATEADNKEITLPKITELPDGYASFIGWAIGETAAEDETVYEGTMSYADIEKLATEGKLTLYARFGAEEVKTIVIGYWSYSNYVTGEIAATIKTEFEQYLTDNGYENFRVVMREYTETKVADLVDAIQSNGDVDYFIGGGKNITSTAGTTSGEKLTTVGSAVQMKSRYIVRLTDNELAGKFTEYSTTADATVATI